MEKTNKFLHSFNFITFSLLLWTCQYSKESATLGQPLNARTSRLLKGETVVQNIQRYSSFKERIKDLADEDNMFLQGYNSITQDDNFQTRYSPLHNKNNLQKRFNKPKHYDGISEHYNLFKYVEGETEGETNVMEDVNEIYDYVHDDDYGYVNNKVDDDIDIDVDGYIASETVGEASNHHGAHKDADRDLYMDDNVQDDNKYSSTKAYNELKGSKLYKKIHLSEHEHDNHENEFEILKERFTNRKNKYEKKPKLYSLINFIKKADAKYETKLIKMLTSDHNTNHKDHVKLSNKRNIFYEIYLKAFSPLLLPILFVVVFVMIDSPIGIFASSMFYILGLAYFMYKLVKCKKISKIYKIMLRKRLQENH
ncbi:Plasmodium exported protein, unknown function [Plasmodium ovale curtisi]|nr:Plasmodium exported protein, unknown function [Plasmodium ovale curtisi]SBT01454.1 Plasmodium exported protein, unknown function [Plasmodium ovale curtisi]